MIALLENNKVRFALQLFCIVLGTLCFATAFQAEPPWKAYAQYGLAFITISHSAELLFFAPRILRAGGCIPLNFFKAFVYGIIWNYQYFNDGLGRSITQDHHN
jgi:hypothetical protein